MTRCRWARRDSVLPKVVERVSQRAIVIGKGGARVKAIGEAARKELVIQKL